MFIIDYFCGIVTIDLIVILLKPHSTSPVGLYVLIKEMKPAGN